MKRKVAVRGIFVHEGTLLCIWQKPYRDKDIDYWCVVGGGVDPGEGLLEALDREIIEETGVKPVIGKLLFMQQYIHKDHEQLELFYNIENAKDYQKVDLSKSSHGLEEIEKIEFLDPSKNRVLPEFLQHEDWANFDPHADVKYLSYL